MLVLHQENLQEVPEKTFDENRYFRGDEDYPGKAVYESVRTYNREPFRLEDHLKRLFRSAEALGWPLPKGLFAYILQCVLSVIQKASFDPQFIRITATPQNLLIISRTLEIDSSIYEGVSVMTRELERRHFDAKRVKRPELDNAYKFARLNNFFECLLVNRKGELTEGTRSNIMWVRNGILHWCPFALEGITQAEVLKLADRQSIPIPTQKNYKGGLPLAELRYIQEMFITQTSRGIVPIINLNGQEIGDGDVGPITHQLMEKFQQLTHEKTAA